MSPIIAYGARIIKTLPQVSPSGPSSQRKSTRHRYKPVMTKLKTPIPFKRPANAFISLLLSVRFVFFILWTGLILCEPIRPNKCRISFPGSRQIRAQISSCLKLSCMYDLYPRWSVQRLLPRREDWPRSSP